MMYDMPRTARANTQAAFGWLNENWSQVQSTVRSTGWALCRETPFRSTAELAVLRDTLGLAPYRPTETFSPRQNFGDDVLSPVRWPTDRVLCPYTEQSYSAEFPGMILMLCARPAKAGGETLIVDTREILRLLPTELVNRFAANGWMMTRTFRPGFGISAAETFCIPERAELESWLAGNLISYSWMPGGVLSTSRVRPAVIRHPLTGDSCWFNQADFLSEWSLETAERAVLLRAFGTAGLPVNTAFGDGSPLSSEDVLLIQNAHDELAQEIAWRSGDLLVLDNLAVAHGRRAYQGDRAIYIAMTDPLSAAWTA